MIFFTGFQTVAGERAGKWEVYFVGQQMRGQELTNGRVSVSSFIDPVLAAVDGLADNATPEEIAAVIAAGSGRSAFFGLAGELTGVNFEDPVALEAFAEENDLDLVVLAQTLSDQIRCWHCC